MGEKGGKEKNISVSLKIRNISIKKNYIILKLHKYTKRMKYTTTTKIIEYDNIRKRNLEEKDIKE